MNERDHYRHLNNAIKYLKHKIYEIDKQAGFKFPNRKAELEPYARQMRGIVEDVLATAKVNKVIGHEMDFGDNKPKKTDDEEET